ncbi:hypothetical protein [Fluviispira vulneris]|uniref:hypothetical protein n=1 Tax=Fluviispira vulneris TaxID=2763012 RepID=UPI001646CB5A|nr:hypothetical protein [Fluviispira vulneris]
MKIKIASIFIPIFLFVPKIHADNAYVYCSSIHHEWKWLKYDYNPEDIVFGSWGGNTKNKGTMTVSGQWKYYTSENKYFTFFVLDDAENKYNELKILCRKQHGKDYMYPQPVEEVYDGKWSAFANADNTLYPGYVTSKVFRSPIGIPRFLFNQ